MGCEYYRAATNYEREGVTGLVDLSLKRLFLLNRNGYQMYQIPLCPKMEGPFGVNIYIQAILTFWDRVVPGSF